MRKVIAINEKGRAIGEGHHNAKLTDAQVDSMRDLREGRRFTYDRIAKLFGVSKSTVYCICNYRRRAQTPMRWKTVRVASG